MLKSKLFRDDNRLQRCLVDNTAHVTLHSSGDFVSKIQEALVILDNAVLTGDDVSTQRYEQSTADAVLAYKSGVRDIVNHSYQQTADNIVGIMTIKQMDKEMAELEPQMPAIIERARLGGFQRTFAAFMQVAGFGPVPLPGRVDPNEANRQRTRALAVDIFDDPNPNMEDIGDTLGDMKNRIASPTTPIQQAHFPDSRCGMRSAFVVGNRVPIMLCPKFFGSSDEERIRTMVHESAHLVGIGDSSGEAYYLFYNRRNEDPQIVTGTPKSTKRADVADTWAKYVNAVTGQKPDT